MMFVLRGMQQRYRFELAVEDVDSREDWLSAHGSRVPVLIADNGEQQTELCWGRADDDVIVNWLKSH